MCRIIFREGKMDIKMLDELLRGTIDPTHRNEAEKKLTEVTHFLFYITFGVVLLSFIVVIVV
jgi:cytochrome b561